MNLDDSRYFSDHEFDGREEEVLWASTGLFVALDNYRERLGQVIRPSPVRGALTRFTGSKTSQHFSDCKQKLSTAIDVFVEGNVRRAWQMACMSGLFGGVGLYMDTTGFSGEHEPMLHLDIRPSVYTTIWVRDNRGKYLYVANDWTNMMREISRI